MKATFAFLCVLVLLATLSPDPTQAQRGRENRRSSRRSSAMNRFVLVPLATLRRSLRGRGVWPRNYGVSSIGRILDPAKATSRITVSKDGRIAYNTHRLSHNANVVGVRGYRRGRHQWTFRINGLVLQNGLGVGVTTLPLDGNTYQSGWSPNTVWAWFSNQFSGGRSRTQTSSSARMHRWQNGDILTMTLNCGRGTLSMVNHMTGERKRMVGIWGRGNKPLYLWVFLGQPGHRIVFL